MVDAIVAVAGAIASATGIPEIVVYAAALIGVAGGCYAGLIPRRLRHRITEAVRKAMRRGGTAAAVAIMAVVVAACETSDNRLGENDSSIHMQPVDEIVRAIGEACPDCGEKVYTAALASIPDRIEIRDGKDKQGVTLDASIGQGGFLYEASREGATEPAKQRADIVETLTDAQKQAIKDAFPNGLSGFVQTVTGALGGG
jgi:hypothetical protein